MTFQIDWSSFQGNQLKTELDKGVLAKTSIFRKKNDPRPKFRK
jgi:hypothetical protein